MDRHILCKKANFLCIFSINSGAAQLSKNWSTWPPFIFQLPRRCESMFNVVIKKLNVVGVWYTNDQIIPTGMDWLLCVFHNTNGHLFLIIREPGTDTNSPWWLQEVSTSCMSISGIWNPLGPQWQPDTTGVVVTPFQHIHIDNRGQPACWNLMGLACHGHVE